MIKSYTNLTNKSFFHELYYSLIILQYVVPCIYIYIVHWLDTLCLIQPIPFQAHRFYIEISLFSLSGIILNNRKLLNSPRNVCWRRASLCNFRFEHEELKYIATAIYIGITNFTWKTTCLLCFHWKHFLKVRAFLFTDICHKMCKSSDFLSVNKVTSLETQCTISLYLTLKR